MSSATRVEAVRSVSSSDTRVATDADFEAWMSARQSALQRTAFLLTAGDRHAADDLVAGTLAKMYLAWGRVRSADSIDAYARKVLLNEHRASYRRPWRRRETVTDVLPDRGTTDATGRDEALWRLVCALPPRQRQVVVLRYYEELTEAETAELLGISVGTVKSQTFKALRHLRAELAEEDR